MAPKKNTLHREEKKKLAHFNLITFYFCNAIKRNGIFPEETQKDCICPIYKEQNSLHIFITEGCRKKLK